jgi:hypothetical protein
LVDLGDRLDAGGSAKDAALSVAELCPSRSRLLALASSSAYLAMDEYLELFDGAVSVAVEGETAWPCQPLIDYDSLVE